MLTVIPGILENEFADIKKKVAQVAPFVEWVQIDLADGKLVENTSFDDPGLFSGLPSLPRKELHMMVENPSRIVEDWINAGFERIVAQIEGMRDPEEFIDLVQLSSVEVGLALDLGTPVQEIEKYLELLDVILLMGVDAGFSGQEFDSTVLDKIEEIREFNSDIPIAVDGGINLKTARMCANAGATRVISTSFIFKADNIEKAIKELAQAG